jgi:hypothetical protein
MTRPPRFALWMNYLSFGSVNAGSSWSLHATEYESWAIEQYFLISMSLETFRIFSMNEIQMRERETTSRLRYGDQMDFRLFQFEALTSSWFMEDLQYFSSILNDLHSEAREEERNFLVSLMTKFALLNYSPVKVMDIIPPFSTIFAHLIPLTLR